MGSDVIAVNFFKKLDGRLFYAGFREIRFFK